MPDHHRGSGQQFHSRLRPHDRLSQPGRFRRAAGRRHGLCRRHDHALLRLAAGQGHRLGADARGDDRAHAPRAVGIPHPRRRHQSALPRSDHHASALRARPTTPRASSTRRRSCSHRRARATGDHAHADLHRRRRSSTAIRRSRAGAMPRAIRIARACRAACRTPPAGRDQAAARCDWAPTGFAQWMLRQKRVLLTDTTCAMRTSRCSRRACAPSTWPRSPRPTRALLPQLFSVECWGGATFDVAMRFLKEDPWERLAALREAMPNMLLQMLLRSANAVGYTNYPDNVVQLFRRAGGARPASMCSASSTRSTGSRTCASRSTRCCEAGKLCEAAICYTGDLCNPKGTKYTSNIT